MYCGKYQLKPCRTKCEAAFFSECGWVWTTNQRRRPSCVMGGPKSVVSPCGTIVALTQTGSFAEFVRQGQRRMGAGYRHRPYPQAGIGDPTQTQANPGHSRPTPAAWRWPSNSVRNILCRNLTRHRGRAGFGFHEPRHAIADATATREAHCDRNQVRRKKRRATETSETVGNSHQVWKWPNSRPWWDRPRPNSFCATVVWFGIVALTTLIRCRIAARKKPRHSHPWSSD